MKALAVYVLVFFAFLAVARVQAVSNHIAVRCVADHQCEQNEYCYLTSNTCAECVDCAIYKRESSSVLTCVKFASDCGACLSGYKEEYLADGKKRELCKIMETTTAQPNSINEALIYTPWVIVVSVIFVCIIFVCVIGVCFFWNNPKKLTELLKGLRPGRVIVEDGNELHPPPYSERVEEGALIPTALPALDPGGPSSSESFHINISEPNTAEFRQKAVPFLEAQYPYNQNAEDEDSEPDLEIGASANNLHSPTPPELHDEETMASSWIPGNRNETGEVTPDSGVASTSSSATEGQCCRVQSDEVSTASGTLSFQGLISRPADIRPREQPDTNTNAKRPRLDPTVPQIVINNNLNVNVVLI